QRQWPEQHTLIALVARAWYFSRGPMDPDVGRLCHPGQRPRVQIGVVEEAATIEEALAHIADRALHLALGLGTIWPAGTDAKAPVGGDAPKLGVLERSTADPALVVDDHRLHLVEEQFSGHAAKEREGFFEAAHENAHRLAGIELQPQQPRVG